MQGNVTEWSCKATQRRRQELKCEAEAKVSIEMHRQCRGQRSVGTAEDSLGKARRGQEKQRPSKERTCDDLQRLGKAERRQGYVRRG